MKQRQRLIGNPASLLPTIAAVADRELAVVKERYATLLEARHQPHVLDHASISQSIKLHAEHQDFLSMFRETLNIWSSTRLSESEQQDVSRLDDQIDSLQKALSDFLTLAGEVRQRTMEKVLVKSDMEL